MCVPYAQLRPVQVQHGLGPSPIVPLPFKTFVGGVAPKMATHRAWLSLDAVHIVFATAELIQQWRFLTYARQVLVETPNVQSVIAHEHIVCLVYALHV